MVASAALVSACTPDPFDPQPVPLIPGRGGAIEFGVLGEPATLDPYGPQASALTYALAGPVFPMLYRFLPDGTTTPDLAASLVVSRRTARLTLEERQWSSGRRITARDVIASIARARPPSGFALVRRVIARGPHIVELTGATNDWESTLATAAFVLPRGRLFGGNVSGGPFRFADYDRGRSLTYEPNPTFPEPPLADDLTVSFVEGTDLLVRLLQSGRLDAAALPSSVNLDDRLDELGIAYDEALGSEQIGLVFNPNRVSEDSADGIVGAIEIKRLADSFIRDDGDAHTLDTHDGTVPSTLSIAAPEGDELLGLILRALQIDLADAGVISELITAPVSTLYGGWQHDAPADVSLLRAFKGTTGDDWIPLASVVTLVAWRDEVHGIAVNPFIEGPLWNAGEWWKEPSI